MENLNDGNPQLVGDQEKPISDTSQATSQLSKDDLQALVHRLDAYEKQLKGLQKGTDKQIASVRDDVKRILELKEQGLNETQIQRELMIDQLLGQNVVQATVAAQQPAEIAYDVETVVKAMQFDENDIAVAAVKKAYAGEPAKMISQLAQLKITQSKPISPAVALPPTGGQSGGGKPSAEALKQNYINDMRAARGKSDQLRAIKDKYIKEGVNIHEIDFS